MKQKKKVLLGLFIVCLSFNMIHAQTKHSRTSLFTSYNGLVMAGYQGWFNTPSDGANRGWVHYGKSGKFEPGFAAIDLWPDVSEYQKTYKTPFLFQNGDTASVFSSYDESTVNLHFKWMREYGIDGAFVQRFVTNLKNKKSLNQKNVVLKSAIKASIANKRAIAVMYDLSGMQEKDIEVVINDWKYLVDSLKIASRGNKQTYLYHNHKPLVALWGVGFNDHRKYSLDAVHKIMDFLQNDPVYGGCSILLGVPTFWREQKGDAVTGVQFHQIIKRADIIHPWFVGRYDENNYPKFKELIKVDMAWCKQNGLGYVPVVFPGFSWSNLKVGSSLNSIPRNNGDFYWKQLAGAVENKASMLYVAMFDELDEATAIFKIAKTTPVGASKFVTFEPNIPNDYYLFLTGYAAKMLKKQIPFQQQKPAYLKQLNTN